MTYRRTKTLVTDAQAWRKFVQANAPFLRASGVPISLYESRELFDDLLMHGYIDHHPDPTNFGVSDLSGEQREALIEVVARYLQAGFPDPGILMIIYGDVSSIHPYVLVTPLSYQIEQP